MTWRDLLHPERAVALAARGFCCFLALLLASELFGRLVAQARLSGPELMVLLGAWLAVSPVAYLIRERRRARPRRRMPRHGAERQPILPRTGGAP